MELDFWSQIFLNQRASWAANKCLNLHFPQIGIWINFSAFQRINLFTFFKAAGNRYELQERADVSSPYRLNSFSDFTGHENLVHFTCFCLKCTWYYSTINDNIINIFFSYRWYRALSAPSSARRSLDARPSRIPNVHATNAWKDLVRDHPYSASAPEIRSRNPIHFLRDMKGVEH